MADAAPENIVPDTSVEDAEKREAQIATRKKWLTRLAIAIAVVAVIWIAYYSLFGRNHVSTDNAYVNAEVAQVTPLISGQAIEVRVKDTQAVKKGDILVRLDPTNAQIALAQAEADLAEARRKFRQTVANSSALSARVSAGSADIDRARAAVSDAQAGYEKARIDLSRRQALAASGGVSGEELTEARKALASAQAGLATARAGVTQAQASRQSASGELQANDALVRGSTEETDPAVLAAKAKLQAAQLDLERATIRAPIDGVVTKRQIQLGQRVAQGAPVMTIIPISQVYVEANFKERQLRNVRIGMPAEVTADIYGGSVKYHGRVAGIGGGTGSSMALIPAQNATGNWIKVVQRLPVRIELDPKELRAHPLRVGLSTEADIDISGAD
jgi:membrane fusion protein (multidrug efflux system)